MKIGNREFQTKGHTYVMGILNVTPDSFSDGGKWNQRDKALRHVEEMLEEGADIIDIGGESTRPGHTFVPEEEEIARVVPVIGLPCCLMHNRKDTDYREFVRDVVSDLEETLALAARAGIPGEKIILDPGVGFAKSYEQNLEIIRRMDVLGALGCPLLLGCSRKSVIGLTLDLPADQRLEGTLVTTVAAVCQGAMFVRVHDVKENVRAVRMAEAVWPRAQG